MAQARNGVMLLVDTNKEKTLLPLRTLPVLTPLLHLLHVALRQMVELSPIWLQWGPMFILLLTRTPTAIKLEPPCLRQV